MLRTAQAETKTVVVLILGVMMLVTACAAKPVRAEESVTAAPQQRFASESRTRLRALIGIRWWDEISKKPLSWYRTDEGLEMAEKILSWQHENGGWPLMNTTRVRFTEVLEQYAKWKHARKWDKQPRTNINESLSGDLSLKVVPDQTRAL